MATVGPESQSTPISAQPELRIGVDEWVAQAEQRRQTTSGWAGFLAERWRAIPVAWRYAAAILLLLTLPLVSSSQPVLELLGVTDNAFIVRIATRFLNFALLAVGLNVVVGYAGLLDLGYVAFFGIAGYLYAYLSSDFVQIGGLTGIHLPSLISVPLIVAITALVGWGLGFVSFRLAGDYLAIVTLAFGQIFVQLALTATRVEFFWLDKAVDLTRGPNGINNLDNLTLFGWELRSATEYYYLFCALLIAVYLMVWRLNQSRIGRAWRSMREDELAAEAMGMPTRQLKLLAFATGAGIAALAGAVDTAWQGNVVPDPRYSILTLINVYAMVVLGGIGSLPGVVLGALIFTALPEVLRSPEVASWLFYGGLLLILVWTVRPARRLLAVVAATLAGGLALKWVGMLLAPALWGSTGASGMIGVWAQRWLLIPIEFQTVGNIVTLLAVATLLWTLYLRSGWRWVLLGVTLYLWVFAWETRLAMEPAATRILIVGATLVALMIGRPQGLLGKPEVKVV